MHDRHWVAAVRALLIDPAHHLMFLGYKMKHLREINESPPVYSFIRPKGAYEPDSPGSFKRSTPPSEPRSTPSETRMTRALTGTVARREMSGRLRPLAITALLDKPPTSRAASMNLRIVLGIVAVLCLGYLLAPF